MSFLSRREGKRRAFALYVDEFQNIATESFGTVLTEARKFGLCLTMAHQSLKQLDEKLISLILGNAQTQVYFRVGRQDAERLAKESANIIEKLMAQEDDVLMQEERKKLSLSEMWEVAFHGLARLEHRKAYVMVKGAMEHPEVITTLTNPVGRKTEFVYSERYYSMDELLSLQKKRKLEIEEELRAQSVGERQDRDTQIESLDDLSFLDGK